MLKKIFIFSVFVLAVAGFSSCKKTTKSSEKAITEFWVGDVKYQINGTNITHLYPKPSENKWTDLVPMPVAPSKVLYSKGASIDPPITEKRDFLQEQTYTVTAEYGSKQVYKVKAEKTQYVGE